MGSPKSNAAQQDEAQPRWLDYVPLAELTQADRNPKLHEVDKISASLDAHGVVDVITLDERTGTLISGHGRRKALVAAREQNPHDPPEGVLLIDGVWQVPVVRGWQSIDDAHADAALITMNELTIQGGWEVVELSTMLTELAASDHDLFTTTGYTDDRLDTLMASLDDSDPDMPSGGTEPQLGDTQYKVIISCTDESHQAEILELAAASGWDASALMQ